ncbi:hypothetical protein PanWU01x14_136950 [Parasponia andersonii]|uniref:Uncharacterized protein n=1 Tax=Parasponia andersonii TaxID=3476 RepID=A0A2P5CNE6_PARAD|nr:hypothetical protein PanWU01x14_136950 [Parasponia andersonii]
MEEVAHILTHATWHRILDHTTAMSMHSYESGRVLKDNFTMQSLARSGNTTPSPNPKDNIPSPCKTNKALTTPSPNPKDNIPSPYKTNKALTTPSPNPKDYIPSPHHKTNQALVASTIEERNFAGGRSFPPPLPCAYSNTMQQSDPIGVAAHKSS